MRKKAKIDEGEEILTVYKILGSENKLCEDVEITPDAGLMLNKLGALSSPMMEYVITLNGLCNMKKQNLTNMNT